MGVSQYIDLVEENWRGRNIEKRVRSGGHFIALIRHFVIQGPSPPYTGTGKNGAVNVLRARVLVLMIEFVHCGATPYLPTYRSIGRGGG